MLFLLIFVFFLNFFLFLFIYLFIFLSYFSLNFLLFYPFLSFSVSFAFPSFYLFTFTSFFPSFPLSIFLSFLVSSFISFFCCILFCFHPHLFFRFSFFFFLFFFFFVRSYQILLFFFLSSIILDFLPDIFFFFFSFQPSRLGLKNMPNVSLLRGDPSSPTSVLYMTLNHLITNIQFRNFRKCEVPVLCLHSRVYSDPEWLYLLGFNLWVKQNCLILLLWANKLLVINWIASFL